MTTSTIGNLELFRLNIAAIIMLPKTKEAFQIQQYGLICFLNANFKIFNKVASVITNGVTDHVVGPTKRALMQGGNVLDWVVVLHETVHEMHREKVERCYAQNLISKWPITK